MFKNNVVISIKVGQNFLPDNESIVQMPFGTEYSVLIKNLNNKPVNIKMFIDGKLNGIEKGFLVKEKESITINSFLDPSFRSLNNTCNALKFVNKSPELNSRRVENIEDSLLRFEVEMLEEIPNSLSAKDFKDFLKEIKPYDMHEKPQGTRDSKPFGREDIYPGVDRMPLGRKPSFPGIDRMKEYPFLQKDKSDLNEHPFLYQVGDLNSTNIFHNQPMELFSSNVSMEGLTVPGKKVEQSQLEIMNIIKYKVKESICFVFKLVETHEVIIENKEKKTCSVCNKKYKSKYNYCPIDGSYLN